MYWVRGRMHREILRLQLSRCDQIFAVSAATHRQLVDGVGVDAAKVQVASTGVSERWLELPSEPHREPMSMVWIGSLTPEKNPLLARRAYEASGLADRATLVFVGDGSMRAHLERDAPAGMSTVGSVADVGPHLTEAGCLVLSSQTEGLPGVILEALGAGVPVIATNVGGVSDIVRDAETGYVVEPGDIESMAEAMRRMADDPMSRKRMGDNGRALVASRYLLRHSIDRWDQLLRAQRAGVRT
jgi:glycosyltransferase involved in cell wall biosynthesis